MLVTPAPGLCCDCHIMRYLFVNRAGRTKCMQCSGENYDEMLGPRTEAADGNR
jgi:hypothetical protein